MTERKSLSTRTRFEVMKRDGHRCRYCGATAVQTRLVVDHVISVADGGTDDENNLVTACDDCNAGKSDIPLDEKRYASIVDVGPVTDHADQIRAYLEAQLEVLQARQEVLDEVNGLWIGAFGCDAPAHFLASIAVKLSDGVSLVEIDYAIYAAARHPDFGARRSNFASYQTSRERYALACINHRRRAGA
jgi:hypothetical protein